MAIQWATIPGYHFRTILGVAGDPASDRRIKAAQQDGKSIEWHSWGEDRSWDNDKLNAKELKQVARALKYRESKLG